MLKNFIIIFFFYSQIYGEVRIKFWKSHRYLIIGNHLIQLYNAIGYCYKIGCPHLYYPNHPIIKGNYLKVPVNKQLCDCKNVFEDIFFQQRECFGVTQSLISGGKYLRLLQIENKLAIPPLRKLSSKTLVIHIRAGDIFSDNNPHPSYLQPCLSFYTTILDANKYEKVILMSISDNNPVVKKLLELYDNIEYERRSLEEDLSILLSATDVVSSIGTFVFTVIQLSNNIKKIYVPSYDLKSPRKRRIRDDVEHIYYNLYDYHFKQGLWRNSDEQKLLMINYKINSRDYLKV